MSRRLIISPRAEADLEKIGDYIAQDNPRAAARLVATLRNKCALIALQPMLYPPQDEVAPGFRRLWSQPFGIWFRVLEDGAVRIERIVHGARDLPSLFGGEG